MSLEALEDWNPWWNSGEVPSELKGIGRDKLREAKEIINLQKVKIYTGVRRSGKSTLLYQIIDCLLEKTDPKNIVLMNFDDIRLSSKPLDEIYKEYIERMLPQKPYIFLDEIHNAVNWTSLVRRLIDQRKANIHITDSSSYFIPVEYARILTGRKITLEVYPLSFKEYLRFKNIKLSFLGTEEKAAARGYLKEYMEKGGFPEPFFMKWNIGKKVLIEYFNDIVTRDVVSRFGTNYTKTKDLAYYLISNASQKITYRKLRNTFKMGLETIQKYIEHLEQVYLIFKVNAYSQKLKEQITQPKKIYTIDTGLMNAIGFKTSENLGPTLENLIFIELKRRGYQIYYLPLEKGEIDFIAKKNLEIEKIINVCYDLTEEKTRKREIENMIKALKKLGKRKGEIITWEQEEKIKINNKEIKIIPAYKWLLQKQNKI